MVVADSGDTVCAPLGRERSCVGGSEPREECDQAEINNLYRDDFLETLDEIRICFDSECFIAAIALSGKILEVSLRETLLRHGVEVASDLGLGKLIGAVRDSVADEYVDPSLGNVANIINESRKTAVHAKEKVPVPSRDQTIMVLFAMRDVVRRNLSHQASTKDA